jgi:antitoxin VapB
MNTAKIFTTGGSQAVRIPKEYRFDENDEIIITKVDDMVILYPRRKGWELLRKGLSLFTDDFMADRNQPMESDKREPL